jgi:hypothetical protein
MTQEQIIADFYKFRLRVWHKASSTTVAGRIEVRKGDSDLLDEVARLLASLPQEQTP